MERTIGPLQKHYSQEQRVSEISRLLREAQQMCRNNDKDLVQNDGTTQQLFGKIATLLDDVIAVLARHQRQQPPPRTLH